MKSLLDIITRVARHPSQPWALATLVRATGSTYRKPGACLLVAPDGSTTGVLSGGCLEEEIGRIGGEVIDGAAPVLLSFDTRRLYGCDGKVDIFVEGIPGADERGGNLLTRLGSALKARQISRVRTCFEGGELGSELLHANALVSEQPGVFIHAVPPPVRLLLFGGGPEIAPLLQFGSNLGWCIDCFTHPSELPTGFKPDAQTAAVVMNHNFGRDLTSLDRLLPLQLSYLGLLGPRKRHAELLDRLQDYRDFEPRWLESLHAPAGLDIGSETPEEIALSIVSEISAVLAKRSAGFLRDRRYPIHACREPMEAAR